MKEMKEEINPFDVRFNADWRPSVHDCTTRKYAITETQTTKKQKTRERKYHVQSCTDYFKTLFLTPVLGD